MAGELIPKKARKGEGEEAGEEDFSGGPKVKERLGPDLALGEGDDYF